MLAIEAININKIYNKNKNPVKALSNVSLSVKKGEFLAVLGESGSGKSTLMNILGCLDRPDSGCYSLGGTNILTESESNLSRIRSKKIGFIFQKFNLIPTMSAIENVELPMMYMNIKRSIRKELALEALSLVGLESRISHKPNELSGGQQQRVAIARAIAHSPEIILADEPTGNLDSKSGEQIMKLLNDLHQRGRTIVLITHNEKTALIANRCVRVVDGELL